MPVVEPTPRISATAPDPQHTFRQLLEQIPKIRRVHGVRHTEYAMNGLTLPQYQVLQHFLNDHFTERSNGLSQLHDYLRHPDGSVYGQKHTWKNGRGTAELTGIEAQSNNGADAATLYNVTFMANRSALLSINRDLASAKPRER